MEKLLSRWCTNKTSDQYLKSFDGSFRRSLTGQFSEELFQRSAHEVNQLVRYPVKLFGHRTCAGRNLKGREGKRTWWRPRVQGRHVQRSCWSEWWPSRTCHAHERWTWTAGSQWVRRWLRHARTKPGSAHARRTQNAGQRSHARHRRVVWSARHGTRDWDVQRAGHHRGHSAHLSWRDLAAVAARSVRSGCGSHGLRRQVTSVSCDSCQRRHRLNFADSDDRVWRRSAGGRDDNCGSCWWSRTSGFVAPGVDALGGERLAWLSSSGNDIVNL